MIWNPFSTIYFTSDQRDMISTKERLQLCCKPTYKPRRVKNKGAILVLVWNYLIMSVFYSLNLDDVSGYACLLACSITLPIAGWLADAHIGRYKVIRCSVWIIWIATVLATVSSVIAQLVDGYSSTNKKVQLLLNVFMAIGLGGYQANILQFGMDQLHDASTTEIMAFIIWYVWTLISSGIMLDFISACLSEQYIAISSLLLCVNLTLALSSLFCCNHWLLKEPIKRNSFKLAYKVIKYAIKHKYPRQRSAFTYCEDELPSRIDFGKIKYGGPFTTEQVEDVKTFLRVLPVTIVGGALFGGAIASGYLRNRLNEMLVEIGNSEVKNLAQPKKCYSEASFTHTIYYASIPLTLVHELLLYPVFHRCFPQLESLQKVFVGMLLLLVRVLILLTYEIVSRYNHSVQNNSNATIPCLFYTFQGTLNTHFDYHWMAIPDFIVSISAMILYTGAVQFFSAQVPYFMKGLAVGVTYSSLFLSGALWFVLSIPFNNQKFSNTWGDGCGFWYYMLLLTIAETIMCVILIILTRWYKKRRRQDVLPNEHIFAERYYSRLD